MSVEIKETTANSFTVNGKEIYVDTDGDEIHREELTKKEKKHWNAYKKLFLEKTQETQVTIETANTSTACSIYELRRHEALNRALKISYTITYEDETTITVNIT